MFDAVLHDTVAFSWHIAKNPSFINSESPFVLLLGSSSGHSRFPDCIC
jgi:hypothetical protein